MPGFMKSLNNISRCQSIYRNEKLQAEGICACHHAFILTVAKHPGQTQEAIAKEICLNKSTVTRALAHLESHGYIQRCANPDDKRETLVYPTQKLQDILPAVRGVAKEWNDTLTQAVAPEELAVFYSVLQRLENSAKHLTQEKNT